MQQQLGITGEVGQTAQGENELAWCALESFSCCAEPLPCHSRTETWRDAQRGCPALPQPCSRALPADTHGQSLACPAAGEWMTACPAASWGCSTGRCSTGWLGSPELEAKVWSSGYCCGLSFRASHGCFQPLFLLRPSPKPTEIKHFSSTGSIDLIGHSLRSAVPV